MLDGTVTEVMQAEIDVMRAESLLKQHEDKLIVARNGRIFFRAVTCMVLQLMIAIVTMRYYWIL